MGLEAEAVEAMLEAGVRQDRHRLRAGQAQVRRALRRLGLRRREPISQALQFSRWEIQSHRSSPMEVLPQLAGSEIPHLWLTVLSTTEHFECETEGMTSFW